jgi:hypothetical protein
VVAESPLNIQAADCGVRRKVLPAPDPQLENHSRKLPWCGRRGRRRSSTALALAPGAGWTAAVRRTGRCLR